MGYYNLEFMLDYLEAQKQTKTEDILRLQEPERTIALYAYLKDNDRGSAWENVILTEYPFLKRVANTEGKGDVRNTHDACAEIKVSYSDKVNNYSFWQCRPWEPTAGYFFKCIDRANDWKHLNYFLTKEEFLHELSLRDSLDMTHGRKKDLPGPLTVESAVEWRVELTVRLKSKGKDLKHTKRWNELYLTENIEEVLRDLKNEGEVQTYKRRLPESTTNTDKRICRPNSYRSPIWDYPK